MRILILEDSQTIALQVRTALETLGHECVVCDSLHEAVAAAPSCDFYIVDVVISDHQRDCQHVWDLAERDTPMVLYSALSEHELQLAGIADLPAVAKGNLQELLQKVSELAN